MSKSRDFGEEDYQAVDSHRKRIPQCGAKMVTAKPSIKLKILSSTWPSIMVRRLKSILKIVIDVLTVDINKHISDDLDVAINGGDSRTLPTAKSSLSIGKSKRLDVRLPSASPKSLRPRMKSGVICLGRDLCRIIECDPHREACLEVGNSSGLGGYWQRDD
ncbi:hypothetical protein PIB30_017601 [Stylosanthes scabra]|uniref:Uncharacterized protein n=1 Tax=Stylosanthes scabra TaxID=79078 RepID=A0ABU6U6M3_9FABA|nr:hypothetical protein [Stylosanthes scabra]